MKSLGIVGDTQGRYDVATLLSRLGEVFRDVDEIWHAGDWQHREVLTGLATMAPLTVVNGNAPDDPAYPERVNRNLEGLEVGMVHRPPKANDEWAAGLDICIHGHSHRWRAETVARTHYINVSTPTAAGFSRDRTCGILRLDAGAFTLERIELGTAGPR